MSEEYSLTIKGFTNKAQVEEFVAWYSGQGEQDAAYWFEVNSEKIGTDFIGADSRKKDKWEGNNLISYVKPS